MRIDHPDGLYDPQGYLHQLQEHRRAVAGALIDAGAQAAASERARGLLTDGSNGHLRKLTRPLYIAVEKILGVDEALRQDWPVYGTSGYDFLNVLNGLFVDPENAARSTRLYRNGPTSRQLRRRRISIRKVLILQVSLSSELHMLAYQLDCLPSSSAAHETSPSTACGYALREVIACFPVYRSYINNRGSRDAGPWYVQRAVRRAQRAEPGAQPRAVSTSSATCCCSASRLGSAEDRPSSAASSASSSR